MKGRELSYLALATCNESRTSCTKSSRSVACINLSFLRISRCNTGTSSCKRLIYAARSPFCEARMSAVSRRFSPAALLESSSPGKLCRGHRRPSVGAARNSALIGFFLPLQPAFALQAANLRVCDGKYRACGERSELPNAYGGDSRVLCFARPIEGRA